MDDYTSQKIKTSSLLLMIMVVFLHSYNIDIKQGDQILYFEKDYNWLIQNFISNGITRIAVPLFFLTSGFLFFNKLNFDFEDYKIKINKRFRTLVIPYLFWALFGLLFYFIMQGIPQSQGFFTKKLIKDYSFIEWINAIFNEPIPYQLWFLRDLIVMVFLSPIIYLVTKKLKIIFLAVIGVFWIFNQDSVLLTSEALLFFSTGIYLKLVYPESIKYKNHFTALYAVGWIVLLLLKTINGFFAYSETADLLLLKMSILIGVVAFWKLLDTKIASKVINNSVNQFVGYSFFIYLCHEPLLTIVKKAMFAPLAKTPVTYLLVYFSAPLTVILICIVIAAILKSKLSVIYSIITGNR